MPSPTPSEPRTGHKLYHAATLAPRTAWLVAIAGALSIVVMQVILVTAGTLDIVGSLLADVLVIGALLGYLRGHRLAPAVFGIRWPRARFLVAGVLVGAAAWYINLLIVVWLRPPGDVTGLQGLVEQSPLLPTLFAIALLPALAEELIFRGVLARALAARAGLPWAMFWSAGVFGLYHMLPIQMVSTFMLGLVLAFLAVRANSVIPAIIAHLLNNTIAIVISRDEVPALGVWIAANGWLTLVVALTCVGTGVGLAARGTA